MSDEQPIDETITEEWLKSVGFKWHEFDRQPHKHWVLWLGWAEGHDEFMTSCEDLGVEVTPMWFVNSAGNIAGRDAWFCWLRSDAAHRYSRFLHLRHIARRSELVQIVEALSGQKWNPENHFYGQVLAPRRAEYARKREERLDVRLMEGSHPWRGVEKDETIGRPLVEHQQAHEDAKKGGAK